jgi:hypothetical protein
VSIEITAAIQSFAHFLALALLSLRAAAAMATTIITMLWQK